jgi:hypothetical protein
MLGLSSREYISASPPGLVFGYGAIEEREIVEGLSRLPTLVK